MDGKTARGSRTDTAPAAHLLSAVVPGGRTVSQLRVPDKTTEVTGFTRLLAPFDLSGVVVTADALQTHREHAKWLVEAKKAHYLLIVKGNQPGLAAALRALPWKEVTFRRYDREAGHGRRETRSVRTLTVTDLGLAFPPPVQAAKILRHHTDIKTGTDTRQTGEQVGGLGDVLGRHCRPPRYGAGLAGGPDADGLRPQPPRLGDAAAARLGVGLDDRPRRDAGPLPGSGDQLGPVQGAAGGGQAHQFGLDRHLADGEAGGLAQ
ncbi:ISAs1 family transposase [Streptomyces sp. NPDC054840]